MLLSEAWDEHERQRVGAARAREVVAAFQRHTQVAKALQNTALKRLQALNPDDLSPAQVLRFLVDAVKLERLSQDGEEGVRVGSEFVLSLSYPS